MSRSRSPSLRRRRGPPRGVVAGACALLLASLAPDASAFCRSTTCREQGGKKCETDENGCPTSGAKLFWPTSCVSYAVNKLGTQDLDPEDTRDIIRKTFQAWSDVPCEGGGVASMTFQERDPVSCKRSEYNKAGQNLNVVLFQDDDWRYRGIDGTLAKTSVTYNDATGEIYDADIEVNAAFNTVTITDDPAKVQYDLQSVLTHEVGHFIGIAHSSDSNAVMYPSYSPGSMDLRALSPDDVEALCEIYKPGSGVACNVEPRGGFSPTCMDEAEGTSQCSVTAVGAGAPDGGAGARGASASLAAVLGSFLVTALRSARRRPRSVTGHSGGDHAIR